MKNKQTETKLKSASGLARHSFGSLLCLGAVILICSSALAQNLFVSDADLGNIDEFAPNGARSTFASGLLAPEALAFDSAGNLFVLEGGDIDGLGAAIYKFTPSGVRSTFASPFLCIGPGLAIDSAGNLFVPDWCTGAIYKFTPGGARTTFASGGIISPFGLDFDSAGNLFASDGGSAIYKFTPSGVRSTFASGSQSGSGLHFLAFGKPTASAPTDFNGDGHPDYLLF